MNTRRLGVAVAVHTTDYGFLTLLLTWTRSVPAEHRGKVRPPRHQQVDDGVLDERGKEAPGLLRFNNRFVAVGGRDDQTELKRRDLQSNPGELESNGR